ncbi:Mov34/MPN/PAD-1 family protein [Thermogemmatispora sp.]|uniref:Mov34/MPN/PAD-1 family protein n=1 Tax=Thermogemmatispora sp. TaxID=1968838 RepID=UPI0035E46374
MAQEAREAGSRRSRATVVIPSDVQRALLQDAWSRSKIEACGLLRGEIDERGSWRLAAVHPLPNIAHSSAYFEFAPEDVLQLELSYPGQIIGVYHSHPWGPRGASRTDRETMRRVNGEEGIPWIWLILCGPFTDEALPLLLEAAAGGDRAAEAECANWLGRRLLAYYHDPGKGLGQIEVVLQAQSEAGGTGGQRSAGVDGGKKGGRRSAGEQGARGSLKRGSIWQIPGRSATLREKSREAGSEANRQH